MDLYKNNNKYKVIFQRHFFNSVENFQNSSTFKKIIAEDELFKNEGLSCFITVKKIIICFYVSKEPKYKIFVYDINADDFKTFYLENDVSPKNTAIFNKCIHFKEEIGVFAILKYKNSGDYYPYLLFMEYQQKTYNI